MTLFSRSIKSVCPLKEKYLTMLDDLRFTDCESGVCAWRARESIGLRRRIYHKLLQEQSLLQIQQSLALAEGHIVKPHIMMNLAEEKQGLIGVVTMGIQTLITINMILQHKRGLKTLMEKGIFLESMLMKTNNLMK